MSGRGRRNSRGGMEESPASTRNTRSRGGNSQAANSPSIAPLSTQGSPSQVQGALASIAENSPSQQGAHAPAPSNSNMRSPSQGLVRGVRSPGAVDGNWASQGTGAIGRNTGVRTTGRGRRADIGPAPLRPMVQLSEHDIPQIDDMTAAGTATTVIWGTNINAEVLSTKVERFLWGFRDSETGEEKYTVLIRRAFEDGQGNINLDTADLRAHDPTLYKWLSQYPHEVLPIFDRQVARIMATQAETIADDESLPEVAVRPFNLEQRKTIRDLDPSDIDKLICVEGMVTRTSNVIPDLRVANFRCAKCGTEVQVSNEGGKVEEPQSCSKCKAKSVFSLMHNLSIFSNKQLVKMQEKPNDIPEGETPHAVVLHVFEANVDVCRPGDRVSITGVLRALPMRVNPTQRALHSLFKTYIDVVHVSRDETTRLFSLAASKDAEAAKQLEKEQQAEAEAAAATPSGPQKKAAEKGLGLSQPTSTAAPSQPDEVDAMDMTGGAFDTMADQYCGLGNETHDQTKAKEERIRALSRDPRIYDRLVASMAPNVWEMDDVKKGLMCQLFGGSCKNFPGGRIRGEINLLLVGDPSVSKSQLLSYVHALAPRGIMTSGKGSSAVGLTAYVTKDPETKEMVLESGALVLSDHGICCIDEFDKMSDSARSMLHEAMEQQTVSIAKAGLISTLNARTSVCACANPIGSRYNPHLSVSENINLPPTLLTRFDLIYLVLDKCEEERDRRLAKHLVSLFHETVPARAQQEELMIPKDLLKEYVAFARTRVHPKLNEAAVEELVSAYGTLRQDGRDRKVVVATPRQLESLIRISEALARMKLSEEVGRPEVQEAVRLWYNAMSGSAAGSDGTIDMDNIFTGATTAARQAHKQLPDDLRAILQAPTARPISVDDLHAELQRSLAATGKPGHISKQQLVDAIRTLSDVVSFDERTGVVKPRGTARA